MIIVRMLTNDGIQNFVFNQPVIPGTTRQMADAASMEAAKKAASYIRKTSAAGFIAIVENADDKTGKIIDRWDNCGIYGANGNVVVRYNNYTIREGKYRDCIYAYLGTEEWCAEYAKETNKGTAGWGARAHIEHIVGPLWQCVVTVPYLD